MTSPAPTTALTALSPVEIDTILAANYGEQIKIEASIRSQGQYIDYLRRTNAGLPAIDIAIEGLDALRDSLLDAITASAPYQAEFNRRRWNRYFLVTNIGGHVHRGMGCGTCFPTTQYAWLIELADCDEAEMITEFGEKACTVCFPSAPANPAFHAPGRRDAAAKAEREAEKAAKAADKATKAITAPDGSALRVGYDILRTKVAAQRALSNSVQSFGWYGPTHPNNFLGEVATISAALEAVGIDPKPIIERAAKKIAKEGGEHDIRKSL